MLDNRGRHLAIVVSWAPSNGAGAVFALHESLATGSPHAEQCPARSEHSAAHAQQMLMLLCLAFPSLYSWGMLALYEVFMVLSHAEQALALAQQAHMLPSSHFLLCFYGLCLLWMKAP